VLRSRSIIGLDIGSHQIKAIYLERKRGGWTVTAAGVAPTPPESVAEGIVHEPAVVADAIAALLRERNIPPGEAIAAISGSTVTVRQIRMPNVPASALGKAVRFEAAKYLPSVTESAVEYAVLGKSGEPLQLDVLLVAAPNEMVNSRVAAMERAGLEPVAIDIEAFALLRSLSAAGFDLSEPMAVLNMGAAFTDFHILFDENIALTRSIPMGGSTLTQAIVSAANVSEKDAEAIKEQLPAAGAAVRGAFGGCGGWLRAAPHPTARAIARPRHGDAGDDAVPGRDPARGTAVAELLPLAVPGGLGRAERDAPAALWRHRADARPGWLPRGTAECAGLRARPVQRHGPSGRRGRGGPTRDWLRGRSADLAIATGLALKENVA